MQVVVRIVRTQVKIKGISLLSKGVEYVADSKPVNAIKKGAKYLKDSIFGLSAKSLHTEPSVNIATAHRLRHPSDFVPVEELESLKKMGKTPLASTGARKFQEDVFKEAFSGIEKIASEKPIIPQPIFLSATDKLNNMAKDNPVLQCLIDMYRQDSVPDSEILKVINATLNHQKTGDRFYRFVGKDELSKVLSGAKVTSNRPCHHGRITDVTSNPNYGGVPTLGKYRISFKDLPEFNPIEHGKSRILEKELSKKEFQLIGGYTIDDIEKIEQNTGSGYMHVWP